MPKQLYIPLPCGEARRSMVLRQLGPGGCVVERQASRVEGSLSAPCWHENKEDRYGLASAPASMYGSYGCCCGG